MLKTKYCGSFFFWYNNPIFLFHSNKSSLSAYTGNGNCPSFYGFSSCSHAADYPCIRFFLFLSPIPFAFPNSSDVFLFSKAIFVIIPLYCLLL